MRALCLCPIGLQVYSTLPCFYVDTEGSKQVLMLARQVFQLSRLPRPYCFFFNFFFFSSLSRYWLTNKVHIKRPTTGLLMYTLATRFCNQIYLYGFWPFPLDQNQNPVKYHYYDSLKYGYTSQASPHTMPLEFKALKSLHEQGALKLTVGQCDGAT